MGLALRGSKEHDPNQESRRVPCGFSARGSGSMGFWPCAVPDHVQPSRGPGLADRAYGADGAVGREIAVVSLGVQARPLGLLEGVYLRSCGENTLKGVGASVVLSIRSLTRFVGGGGGWGCKKW